uniref:Uncharacterized protein n=1 Tax=Rhizophora mucronata TaxID=61149 RepID=A0A2P2R0W5_RHIMU
MRELDTKHCSTKHLFPKPK